MNAGYRKSIRAMAIGAVFFAVGASVPIAALANGPGQTLAQGEKSRTKAQKGEGQKQQQTGGRLGAEVPVLILVPVTVDVDKMATGCWARFYDDENFEGDQLTLIGPVDLPDMKFHRRFYWGGLDSVVVGPKATVAIYDDENYRDRNATLKPGDHIKNLDDQKLGLFEDIESLKITCAQ